MATDKQVSYAIYLLDQAGYGTDYITAEYKKLGLRMNERSGKVEDWLQKITTQRASELIGTLKKEVE